MSWKKRALATALAGLCLLSGCTLPGRQQDDTPRDTVDVSDAYFGLAWYKNGTLNPVTDTDSVNAMLREALYEGLFELTSDFTPQNVLCEGYSGDGTTFTFTLKQGVKFWSGQTLTADDVIASYRAAMDNASSPYHSRLAEVQSIEKAGTYQVRIVLSSPNAAFPRLLNIPIYREGSADSGSFADGTGPYVPVENGSVCTLEKNENWHGGFLGTIRHITLVGITRADAAETSFRTGDVSVQRSARIAADDKATVIGGAVDTLQTPSTALHYIGINHANEQLKNANVRRALSAALGRRSLCDTQLQTFADPAVLPVNPQQQVSGVSLSTDADVAGAYALLHGDESAENTSDTSDGTSQDTAKTDASAEDITIYYADDGTPLIDGDGYYIDEDGDRVLNADGEPVLDPSAGASDTEDAPQTDAAGEKITLSLRLLVNSDNAFKVAAAEQLAASWNAIEGVSVTVEQADYAACVERIKEGSFDLYYGETRLMPDFDLRPLLMTGGSLNFGGYSSPDMESTLLAARKSGDMSAFYKQFAEEMPFIPIAFERNQVVIRKNLVGGFAPAPYNVFLGQQNWTRVYASESDAATDGETQ